MTWIALTTRTNYTILHNKFQGTSPNDWCVIGRNNRIKKIHGRIVLKYLEWTFTLSQERSQLNKYVCHGDWGKEQEQK